MGKTIELKLNVDLQDKKVGNTITVAVDNNGTILDRYWRARLRDSEFDGCISLVLPEKKVVTTEIVTEEVQKEVVIENKPVKTKKSKKFKGDK